MKDALLVGCWGSWAGPHCPSCVTLVCPGLGSSAANVWCLHLARDGQTSPRGILLDFYHNLTDKLLSLGLSPWREALSTLAGRKVPRNAWPAAAFAVPLCCPLPSPWHWGKGLGFGGTQGTRAGWHRGLPSRAVGGRRRRTGSICDGHLVGSSVL